MNIELSHNPYTIRTTIVADGRAVTTGKLRDLAADDQRLQMWIERFFPCLLDVYDSPGSLNVTFRGTTEDYYDVHEAARAVQEGGRACEITVSHFPTRDADTILQELRRLFEKAKEGPIPEFCDEMLDAQFQACVDRDFEVCVIATMSVGKSTFLNAMIGRDLLPEDNYACTATVTRVRDTDDLSAFRGRRLCADSSSYTDWQDVNQDVLKEWNTDDTVQIEIEGDILSIKSGENRLMLVDTPGPNNARNANHKACLENFIKKGSGPPPVVLYLLNVSSLFTNDDHTLLDMVTDEMMKAGKQSRDRFMFILTHGDEFDVERKPIKERIETARCHLEKYGIDDPRIFLINGRYAKLVRCQQNEENLTKLDGRHIDDWVEKTKDSDDYNFCHYMMLSPGVEKRIRERMEKAKDAADDKELALLYSGVPAVEEVIQEYIRKYATSAKIHDAVKSFEHLMQRLNSEGRIQRIISRISESEDKLKETHEEMTRLNDKIQKAEKGKELRGNLETMVWERTKEYINEMRNIHIEFSKWRGEFIASLDKYKTEHQVEEGIVELEKARSLLEGVSKRVEEFFGQMRKVINDLAEKEALSQIEYIRNQYIEHLKDLLGSMKSDLTEEINKELSAFAGSMPSSESIAKEVSREIEKHAHDRLKPKTFDEGFWAGIHGLLGGTKKVKFVNLEEFAKQVLNRLQANMDRMKKEEEDRTQARIKSAKEKALKHMKKLDIKFEEYVEKLKVATSTKTKWEQNKIENEARITWFNEFQEKLAELLCV